jgi:hypothetical protein
MSTSVLEEDSAGIFKVRVRNSRNQHEASRKQSSEMSVNFQQITLYYVPEDGALTPL